MGGEPLGSKEPQGEGEEGLTGRGPSRGRGLKVSPQMSLGVLKLAEPWACRLWP